MSRIDTNHTLQDVLNDHRLWLRDQGGSRANLSGTDLSGTDLSGTDLSGTDLSRANLYGANLYGADLSGADLSGTDLSGTDLSGTNLYGADLSRADLSNTLFENDPPIIINTEYYRIVKCKDLIKIGCQCHSVEEWRKFTDEEIDKMHHNALKFWKKYKKFLLIEV